MKMNRRFLVSLLSSVLIAVGSAAAASARPAISTPPAVRGGCGATWPVPAAARAHLKSDPRPGSESGTRAVGYTPIQSGNTQSPDNLIVGFWQMQFIAEGNDGIPDGTVLDAGYAQWHQDGTEIMNSMRPPTTSNICLGVWRKAGGSTYELNHFALSWDTTGVFIGPANIREQVTVARGGQSYEGTFTIDQYDTTGSVIGRVAGRVTATRITVDTRIR